VVAERDRQPVITVSQLGARYGRRAALTDVSFDLTAGFVALVGPNGSGKSTLLRLLATLVPISTGSASLAGHDLSCARGAERARRAFGYLAQEPQDFAHLNVGEACVYAAWLKGVPRGRIRQACRDVIEQLDLGDVRDHKLAHLSGGTRRRAYLAQALVHSPAVVLLDEPTSGLDAGHRVQVWDSLHAASQRAIILYSTHLAEDLRDHADRVLALRDGALSFDGTAEELVQATRSKLDDATELDNALRVIGKL